MNLFRILVAYLAVTGAVCAQHQITYTFSGEISDVPSELANDFQVGDTFSGQFTYAPLSVDSFPNDPRRASYPTSVSNLEFDISDYKISNIGVGDIATSDFGQDSLSLIHI